MKAFKTFFKTTIGMKPQSEAGGSAKVAEAEVKEAGSATVQAGRNAIKAVKGGIGKVENHLLDHSNTYAAGAGAAGLAGVGSIAHSANRMANASEKKAYDYAHEVRQKEQHHTENSKATPLDPETEARKGAKSGRWGGGIAGGLIGAYGGAVTGAATGKHMGLGAGLGALAGAGLGAWAGHHLGRSGGLANATESRLGIEHSKRIMAMPHEERKAYFQHLARNDEISAREAAEWDRHNDREANAEARHQESMDSHHRAHGQGHYD